MGVQIKIVDIPTQGNFPTRGQLYTPQSNEASTPAALIAVATVSQADTIALAPLAK